MAPNSIKKINPIFSCFGVVLKVNFWPQEIEHFDIIVQANY
jgi:hypothetical protein